MIGEPDAGNPHVRFDEGVQETCDTRGAPAPYSTTVPQTNNARVPFDNPRLTNSE
jgi:hypothetical protein